MTIPKQSSRRQIKNNGFIREVHNKAFERGFQFTLEYQKRFGKPNAPKGYSTPDGYNLAEWQKSQKKSYKKGVLAQDRIKRLDDIGFKWGATKVQLKEQWDLRYALTLKYKHENGTPNAPCKYKTPDGYSLGAWQSRQREYYARNELSQDKIKMLEGIGFKWSLRASKYQSEKQ
jgi:hypothetical protein